MKFITADHSSVGTDTIDAFGEEGVAGFTGVDFRTGFGLVDLKVLTRFRSGEEISLSLSLVSSLRFTITLFFGGCDAFFFFLVFVFLRLGSSSSSELSHFLFLLFFLLVPLCLGLSELDELDESVALSDDSVSDDSEDISTFLDFFFGFLILLLMN